jgi:hypothetical protein
MGLRRWLLKGILASVVGVIGVLLVLLLRSVNSASGCGNSANVGHLGDFLRLSEVDAPRSGKMCRCYQGRAPFVAGVSGRRAFCAADLQLIGIIAALAK